MDELKRLQELKLKYLQDQKNHNEKVLDLNTGSIQDFITSQFFPQKLYEQQSNIEQEAASNSGDKAIETAKKINTQRLLNEANSRHLYESPRFNKLKELLNNIRKNTGE